MSLRVLLAVLLIFVSGAAAADEPTPLGDIPAANSREVLFAQDVVIDRLRGVSFAGVGLAAHPRLAEHLWKNSDMQSVMPLLGTQGVHIILPAHRQLLVDMVTQQSDPPQGKDASRFFAVRVELLQRLGELELAARLLDQYPLKEDTPEIQRLRFHQAAMLGDWTRACSFGKGLAGADQPLLAAEAGVLCLLKEGKPNAVALRCQLLAEEFPAFDTRASPFVRQLCGYDNARTPARPPGRLDVYAYLMNPSQFAAFQSVFMDESTDPSIFKLMASTVGLPLPVQIRAAELAHKYGALKAEEVRRLYESLLPDPKDVTDLNTALDAGAGGMRYARFYHHLKTLNTPQAKVQAFAALFHRYPWFTDQAQIVNLFAAELNFDETVPGVLALAPYLRLKALLAGDETAIRRWDAVLTQEAAGQGRGHMTIAMLYDPKSLKTESGRKAVADLLPASRVFLYGFTGDEIFLSTQMLDPMAELMMNYARVYQAKAYFQNRERGAALLSYLSSQPLNSMILPDVLQNLSASKDDVRAAALMREAMAFYLYVPRAVH